ncbi:MAG: OPT/YSL family transporter, partial [Defluviitaleaceae bacterium]|nr:OPT/YSL family transporter [Defluviitaleaceae bacterium]
MKKVSIYEPGVLIIGIILAIFSAAICMQIMGMFGTAPNTSLITGILIMIIARIPLELLKKYRDLERQNYIMSIASAAGFSAANGAFVGVAMVFIMNRTDLIIPLSIGILIGSIISVFSTYKLFDSSIFPANGSWPMATASAKILEAGNEGGKKGIELFQGVLIGAILNQFGLPATGIGIAFVANMVTMAAMGFGSAFAGFAPALLNFHINET